MKSCDNCCDDENDDEDILKLLKKYLVPWMGIASCDGIGSVLFLEFCHFILRKSCIVHKKERNTPSSLAYADKKSKN